jgi:hypothetical protein
VTLQPGDRVRIITWYCGVLARSHVGQLARVQRIGCTGSFLVACREWGAPRWLSPEVAARCLERVES